MRNDRTWPLPPKRHAMLMTWSELLFAHWPLKPKQLQPLIPRGLELDTFDGQAWIGIVPFKMSGVRLRLFPPFPGVSAFPELNVRTYVVADGKPGVWFFSLDATSRLAVRVARSWFSLPYMDAQIRIEETEGGWSFQSRRTHRKEPAAELQCEYGPVGDVFLSQPGTLEHWLTARYCLYSQNRRGLVYRGEIDHEPWPLQTGRAQFFSNTMLGQIDTELPKTSPLLHFSKRIDVLAWSPQPIKG